MPMVWNAEADAKLLAGIIKVYDVKATGDKLREVAALMSPDCTPKALTHRLSKIKAMAASAGTGSEACLKMKDTPGKNKTNGQKKRGGSETVEDDSKEGGDMKRVKSENSDNDIAVGEEVSGGLRA